jgi:hypothetical protein
MREISKIVRIEIVPAAKVYGPGTRNPDRPVVIAWTENGARFAATVPLGAKYVNGKMQIIDPEKYHKSVSFTENGRIKSKFGAFVAKYKCCPCVGLEVVTYLNGRGFFTICVDDEVTE